MAGGRNYGLEHARRNAKARQAGFSSYYEKRKEQVLRKGGLSQAEIVARGAPGVRIRTTPRGSSFLRPTGEAPPTTSDEFRAPYPQIEPTPTINPERPRTLRAGYDAESQILQVTFRDGTAWHYYDVPEGVWESFRATESPGRYIKRVLDFYSYGPA